MQFDREKDPRLEQERNSLAISMSNQARYATQEFYPCKFLRFVANAGDDLEHLAFQLDANHADNFPDEDVTK